MTGGAAGTPKSASGCCGSRSGEIEIVGCIWDGEPRIDGEGVRFEDDVGTEPLGDGVNPLQVQWCADVDCGSEIVDTEAAARRSRSRLLLI